MGKGGERGEEKKMCTCTQDSPVTKKEGGRRSKKRGKGKEKKRGGTPQFYCIRRGGKDRGGRGGAERKKGKEGEGHHFYSNCNQKRKGGKRGKGGPKKRGKKGGGKGMVAVVMWCK